MYSLRFSLKTQKFLIVLALTALVWIVFGQTAHFDWVGYVITTTFIAPVA